MFLKNRTFAYITLTVGLLFFSLLILNVIHGAREVKRLVLLHELPALGIAASSQINLLAGFYKSGGEEPIRDHVFRDRILEGENDQESIKELSDFLETFGEDRGVNLYLAGRDGKLVYASGFDFLIDASLLLSDVFGRQFYENLLRNQHKTAGISEVHHLQPGSLLWGGYLGDLDTFLVLERSADQMAKIQRSRTGRTLAAHSLPTLFLLILTLVFLRFFTKKHSSRLAQTDRKTTVYRTFMWALNLKLKDGERRLISLGEGLKQFGDQHALGSEIIAIGNQQQEGRHSLEKLLGFPEREEPIELKPLLHNVIASCTPRAFRRGIAIHFSTAGGPGLLTTSGNPELVFLILEQFMVLCITLTQEGGDLLLCIQPSTEQRGEVILDLTFLIGSSDTDCCGDTGLEEAAACSGIRTQWLNTKEHADTRRLQIAFPGV